MKAAESLSPAPGLEVRGAPGRMGRSRGAAPKIPLLGRVEALPSVSFRVPPLQPLLAARGWTQRYLWKRFTTEPRRALPSNATSDQASASSPGQDMCKTSWRERGAIHPLAPGQRCRRRLQPQLLRGGKGRGEVNPSSPTPAHSDFVLWLQEEAGRLATRTKPRERL